MYRTVGWYRPHNNSLMRNLFQPCGPVNREQFVLNYYSRVSPIEASSPGTAPREITGPENLAFTATPKAPSSGVALVTSWKIDDVVQAATAPSFATVSDRLGNGNHSVTASVRDPTAFVRLDPGGLLDDSITWTFILRDQLPFTLAAWRATYGADLDNPARDGLVNLVKYALGLDPARLAQLSQVPSSTLTTIGSARYLTLRLPRRMRRPDVDYIAEVGSDLGVWNSGPGHTVTMQDDDTLLVVRDATPLTDPSSRFIRFKARERSGF